MKITCIEIKRISRDLKEHLAARGEKWCPACQWPLPVEAFVRDKNRADGLFVRCRQCHRDSNARYYAENTEKVKAKNARYHAENPERVRVIKGRYRANNPEKLAALSANRRAQKRNATPSWLTDEHRAAIEHHYRLANLLNRLFCTPSGWHVDHIAPLSNEEVSGLHVPWNLRVITAKENLSKKNKLIPELVDKGGVL